MSGSRKAQIESTKESPPMVMSKSEATMTYERNESIKESGTLTLRYKSWAVANNSANAIWGREVASTDALTVAGPPKEDPMPSAYGTQGPLSGGCSERTATGEGA